MHFVLKAHVRCTVLVSTGVFLAHSTLEHPLVYVLEEVGLQLAVPGETLLLAYVALELAPSRVLAEVDRKPAVGEALALADGALERTPWLRVLTKMAVERDAGQELPLADGALE